MSKLLSFALFTCLFIFCLQNCQTDKRKAVIEQHKDTSQIFEDYSIQEEGRDSLDKAQYLEHYPTYLTVTPAIYDLPSMKKSKNWGDNYFRYHAGSMGPEEMTVIPDSICIKINMYPDLIHTGYPQGHIITVKIQLKFGKTHYCSNISCPKLSEEYTIIKNKKIKDEDFFHLGEKDSIGYFKEGGIDISKTTVPTTPICLESKFAIKKTIKEFQKLHGEKYMLNQIIINTYAIPQNKWGKPFKMEHTHPICLEMVEMKLSDANEICK